MTNNSKRLQRSLWSQLPQWAWKLGLRSNVDFRRNPSSDGTGQPETERPQDCADIKQAQVITSRIEYPQVTGTHKPVLDIDFPAQLVPSTTPGHFHLYLDKELEWPVYRRLLKALADAGIIEEGYYRASSAREYTAVRVPWVRKEPQDAAPAPEDAETTSGPQNGAQPSAAIFDEAAIIPEERHIQQEALLREATERAEELYARIEESQRRAQESVANVSERAMRAAERAGQARRAIREQRTPRSRSILNEVMEQSRRDRAEAESLTSRTQPEPTVTFEPMTLRYIVTADDGGESIIPQAAVSRGLINTSESLRAELHRRGMRGADFTHYFTDAQTPRARPRPFGGWSVTPAEAPSLPEWTLRA